MGAEKNNPGTVQVGAPLKFQVRIFKICKRTLLLEFLHFHSTKNTLGDTLKTRKPLFPNWKQKT